uniref:Enoyl-CoA hydratase n=3 Tax=Bionectria ochroleuca TaxID=29856 RepID=A0A8H7TTV6_BIOOC
MERRTPREALRRRGRRRREGPYPRPRHRQRSRHMLLRRRRSERAPDLYTRRNGRFPRQPPRHLLRPLRPPHPDHQRHILPRPRRRPRARPLHPLPRPHLQRHRRPARDPPGHPPGSWRHLPPTRPDRPPRARDLILTGRRVAAPEAYFLGIADRLVEIVPEDGESDGSKILELARRSALSEAVRLAQEICEGGPVAVRAALEAVSWAREDKENEMYQRVVKTEDRDEALKAFQEKRKPVFKGR